MPSPPGPRRRAVLFAAALLLAGLATLAAVGFVFYDRATRVDRSTPTVAVREFMQASLIDRDADRVGLYVCAEWDPVDAMAAVAAARRDAAVQVSWGVTEVEEHGDSADAFVRVTSTVAGNSDIADFRLTVVDRQGWRVCAAERA